MTKHKHTSVVCKKLKILFKLIKARYDFGKCKAAFSCAVTFFRSLGGYDTVVFCRRDCDKMGAKSNSWEGSLTGLSVGWQAGDRSTQCLFLCSGGDCVLCKYFTSGCLLLVYPAASSLHRAEDFAAHVVEMQ